MSSSLFKSRSVHDECKGLTDLDQDRLSRAGGTAIDLAKALFQAIKHRDFDFAGQLVDAGADLEKCFETERDLYRTNCSLLVQVTCQARLKQNHKVIGYLIPYRLVGRCIRNGADLRCYCSNKFEHRCPLFVALKTLGLKKEDEIMEEKNQVVQTLLVNGATIRKHVNPHPTTSGVPDFDIEKARSYLLAKTTSNAQLETLRQSTQ